MATEPCPNCKRLVSTAAQTCPRCGHPLSTELWQESKAKRELAARNGCVGALAVVAALIVVFAVVDWLAPNDASPRQDGLRIVGDGRFGCQSEDTMDRLTRYAADGDQTAFVNLLSASYQTGACIQFRDGEPVHLVDGQFLGNQKVRRPGDDNEYWTALQAVN